jgi:glycosyltransferase involved in cell wall biosynthesis
MKILQIINSLGTGGAEKLLLDTIPLYQKMGVDMDLLVLWDNNFPFMEKLNKETKGNVYILKNSNNLKDIYSLSHIRNIRKIIKNYDIVHVHLFPAQYFVALANIGLNKKLIFTEHSTNNKRVNRVIIKHIDKWFYKFYSTIIAISKDVELMLNNHINTLTTFTTLINNGVNIDAINASHAKSKNAIENKLKNDDFIICQVSAFRIGKDQYTLIKSLVHLPFHFKLILVGTGDENERNKIESLVEELNLKERVFLLGSRMDVYEIIKTADINVLSSKYEGLSLSSVEGMASGKPFIASDVPGLRDIVKDAGLLFPLGDEKALADIILKLSENKSLYNEVALKCQERAQQYDIKVMVNKHLTLYQKLYNDI